MPCKLQKLLKTN